MEGKCEGESEEENEGEGKGGRKREESDGESACKCREYGGVCGPDYSARITGQYICIQWWICLVNFRIRVPMSIGLPVNSVDWQVR